MSLTDYFVSAFLGVMVAMDVGLLVAQPGSPIIAGCLAFVSCLFIVNLVSAVTRATR